MNLKEQYEQITDLWKTRDLPVATLESLSEFGVIVKKENKVIGVIFLYLTLGTPVSLIRYPVVDKKLNKEEHNNAINGLIKML